MTPFFVGIQFSFYFGVKFFAIKRERFYISLPFNVSIQIMTALVSIFL